MKLTEGLYKNDLRDILEPVISIDEYKAKVLNDDDAIVVAFKINNKDAAFDFSSFIERGPYPALDTEVSDRIDSDGFYTVFVEFERKKSFIKNFLYMMSKLNVLVGAEMKFWRFSAYKMAGTKRLSSQNLFDSIRLQKITSLPDVSELS